MASSSHVSRKDFEAVFPLLVEDLSEAAKKYNIPTAALEWFRKVDPLRLNRKFVNNEYVSRSMQIPLEES